MNITKTIERILFVVDRCLRKTFPDDYDARCMYGARAIEALLNDNNFDAHLCGGNVAALVVSKHADKSGFDGFGGGTDGPSHYWVSVGNKIVDLGPSYLPKKSKIKVMSLPFISWSDRTRLPDYLRYDTQINFQPLAPLDTSEDIEARMNNFIARCRNRFASQKGNPKLTNWILRDQKTLEQAAQDKNPWALQMTLYPERISKVPEPF